MTETTSPPQRPSKSRKSLRDFEDAVSADLKKATVLEALATFAPVVLLPAGAGVGAVLRPLPAPLGAVLPAGLAAVAVLVAVLGLAVVYCTGPARRVDWATADAYEQRLTKPLPGEVRAVLAAAQQKVGGRIPTAAAVHLYATRPHAGHDQSCTIDTGGCWCARLRLSAALAPSRRRPLLLIGEDLLSEPGLLKFVLAHEAHHARRESRTLHLLLGVLQLSGWLALGLTLPPQLLLVAAPGLWLATIAARWCDELRADVAAIRATGPDAARAYWARVQHARPRPTGALRVLRVIGWLLGSHPPVTFRARLTARATGPAPSCATRP